MAKMKRILVTGGAGFLGGHLCEYLLAHGKEILHWQPMILFEEGILRTINYFKNVF